MLISAARHEHADDEYSAAFKTPPLNRGYGRKIIESAADADSHRNHQLEHRTVRYSVGEDLSDIGKESQDHEERYELGGRVAPAIGCPDRGDDQRRRYELQPPDAASRVTS